MKIIFINSKGHWVHGWFTSAASLQFGMEALQKAGLETTQVEVENLSGLEKTLDGVSEDTIIWPNAYFVNNGKNKAVWLSERMEARKIPFIGSGFHALQQVLKKDFCQSRLAEHHLPIPSFLIINRENCIHLEFLIEAKNIEFPVVLKPTAESGSIGICKADTLKEAKRFAFEILINFPNSNVILEEFLPSDDITCGFLEMGDEAMLLPTYYIVKNAPGDKNVLSRKERSLSWDGVNKIQPYVTDPDILSQLKARAPEIAKIFGIRGITRIDGRLDKKGVLRFFDVNGLPALCFPDDVTVKQCFTCFPDYPPMKIYEALICTIVHHALLTYGMELPAFIQENHLFNLQSDIVIRQKLAEGV